MQALYNFHFLNTVSKQLVTELDELSVSALDANHLLEIGVFQEKQGAAQGVYVLHYDGEPVYLGKANNVKSRLEEHLQKLSGRQNIDLAKVGYKALFLDKSMGTAANESVLIGIYRLKHPEMWNLRGFGPKDPGKNRDTTVPNYFDSTYPIRADYPVHITEPETTLAALLSEIKRQVPYVFRFNLDGNGSLPIDLRDTLARAGNNVPAEDLLQIAVSALGAGWKGAVLSFGMVLYRTQRRYPHGRELLP